MLLREAGLGGIMLEEPVSRRRAIFRAKAQKAVDPDNDYVVYGDPNSGEKARFFSSTLNYFLRRGYNQNWIVFSTLSSREMQYKIEKFKDVL